MPVVRSFAFDSKASGVEARIDAFIAWAEPGGSGGFRSHGERYDRKSPYFAFSNKHLPHSHATQRSWFVQQEYLKKAASGGLFSKARGDSEPEIRKPLALIRPGRFLSFAKAYVKALCALLDDASSTDSQSQERRGLSVSLG